MKTRSPSTSVNLNPSDISILRIAGFGGCLISGYPHEGGGLFEVACGMIETSLSQTLQSTIVSLVAPPAPCVTKHLEKALDFNPHYVVLQFGATDARCPIRRRSVYHHSESSTVGASRPILTVETLTRETASRHGRPASALSLLRWEIASLLGHIRKIKPITPLFRYVAAIECMVEDCLTTGSTPVVLSPFGYGSRYSMKNAIRYSNALHELYASAPDVIFVDCIRVLADFPRRFIFQHDGIHLSRMAQKLIGGAVGQAILEDILRKNAFDAVGALGMGIL